MTNPAPKTARAHTPGPWSVRPSSNAKNGAAWRDIVSDGEAFGPSYVGEALECDAYLIASAPDLLAALKFVLSAHGEQLNAAFAQAQAAIAKAENSIA